MPDTTMPLDTLLGHLDRLANDALVLWDLPDGATARLINVSENATYLVEAPCGHKSVLRVHREAYHSRRAIECELAWLDALGQAGVVTTPGQYPGRDGNIIQSAGTKGLQTPRHLVLFHFLEGTAPSETGDLTPGFEDLGAIAARCHEHALTWQRHEPFEPGTPTPSSAPTPPGATGATRPT